VEATESLLGVAVNRPKGSTVCPFLTKTFPKGFQKYFLTHFYRASLFNFSLFISSLSIRNLLFLSKTFSFYSSLFISSLFMFLLFLHHNRHAAREA
jgi:hypothetical protein